MKGLFFGLVMILAGGGVWAVAVDSSVVDSNAVDGSAVAGNAVDGSAVAGNAVAGGYVDGGGAEEEDVISNEDVIKMSRANLGDEIIIDEINNTAVSFLVDSISLNKLRSEKVSEVVINEMIKKCSLKNSLVSGNSDDVDSVVVKNDSVNAVFLVKTAKVAGANGAGEATTAVETGTGSTPASAAVVMGSDLKRVAAVDGKDGDMKRVAAVVGNDGDLKGNSGDVAAVSLNEVDVKLTGFVIPVKDLFRFYMSDLSKLSGIFEEWSREVKSLIDKGKNLNVEIKVLEGELFARRVTDNKLFDSEMLDLKSNILIKRDLFKQNRLSVGEFAKIGHKAVVVEGEAMSKRIADAYDLTSKAVKGFDLDAVKWAESENFKIENRGSLLRDEDLFFPVCELIFVEKNACKKLVLLADKYNLKISKISSLHNTVAEDIKACEVTMESLKKDSKKNKAELAVEKKKLSELVKKRKSLENEMKAECGELAKELKTESSELVAMLRERLINIVADIDFNLEERVLY